MNSANPLVTFALFCYNQEEYIREAVKGAFSQTYSPLEIIISDDSSSDDTFDIIQNMVSRYEGPHRIILNRNTTNLGVCAHVNKVFEMASGEIVIGAAGDDISFPERAKVMADEFSKNPDWTSIVSGAVIFGENIKPLLTLPFAPNRRLCALESLSLSVGIQGSSTAYRKSVYGQFPPLNNECKAEDIALTFRSMLIGVHASIPDVLVWYRASNNAIANRPVEHHHVDTMVNLEISALNQNVLDLKHHLKNRPVLLYSGMFFIYLKKLRCRSRHRRGQSMGARLVYNISSRILNIFKVLQILSPVHSWKRRRIGILLSRTTMDAESYFSRTDLVKPEHGSSAPF